MLSDFFNKYGNIINDELVIGNKVNISYIKFNRSDETIIIEKGLGSILIKSSKFEKQIYVGNKNTKIGMKLTSLNGRSLVHLCIYIYDNIVYNEFRVYFNELIKIFIQYYVRLYMYKFVDYNEKCLLLAIEYSNLLGKLKGYVIE
jgi:hypothetical protein